MKCRKLKSIEDRLISYVRNQATTCRMLVICFGRPGAGKTTISNKALELLLSNGIEGKCIDLDVCVPNYMKDNFAKGIYPTLEQRSEFALGACDYLDERLEENVDTEVPLIVSFSFVNTDLRTTFQSRYPDAPWVLIDVTPDIAQSRINNREGHFYKGKIQGIYVDNDISLNHLTDGNQVENSEWDFAPVDFDHVCLNGLNSVDMNAQIIVDVLLSTRNKTKTV